MPSLALIKSLAIVALFLKFVAMAPAQVTVATPGDEQLESMEMRGTIGSYRIGFNYTVRQQKELVAAHYFYVSQLKDIPLKGTVQGQSIDLEGADGSNFHLHFVGNGSNGTKPLTFDNSIGLSGFWKLGNRSLPVDLQMQHSTENPGKRFYAEVTDQPDSSYESMVAKARTAFLNGDLSTVAKYIHFPLRVNGKRSPLIVRNETELNANWSIIFTPGLLAKLQTDVTHEMFVQDGKAMLGDGELWFDDRGLVTVNPVPDAANSAGSR